MEINVDMYAEFESEVRSLNKLVWDGRSFILNGQKIGKDVFLVRNLKKFIAGNVVSKNGGVAYQWEWECSSLEETYELWAFIKICKSLRGDGSISGELTA